MEITQNVKDCRTLVVVDGHEIECFGAVAETANYFLTCADENDDRCVMTCEARNWVQVAQFILDNCDLQPTDLVEIMSDIYHSDMKPYR